MSEWHTATAPAKLNLALVVGPLRGEGKHEVATVLERLTLADTVSVRRAETTHVNGFDDDTLVRAALDELATRSDGSARFEARIDKRIPVAAGLGGGSSDAAAALRLANDLLDDPLAGDQLEAVARSLGSDVPFFLRDGPQLGTGDGTELEPLALPRDYTVLLALAHGQTKRSTADVYAAFDARAGAVGFGQRRAKLMDALEQMVRKLPKPAEGQQWDSHSQHLLAFAGALRSFCLYAADPPVAPSQTTKLDNAVIELGDAAKEHYGQGVQQVRAEVKKLDEQLASATEDADLSSIKFQRRLLSHYLKFDFKQAGEAIRRDLEK